jgi:hypothetical protein
MSEAIEPGVRGLNEISSALLDTSFGIIVVTKDSLSRPWLNFEAGALAKEVGVDPSQRVVPLLFDVDVRDLHGSPLVQFQYRSLTRDGVRDVVGSMARLAGVEVPSVHRRFDRFWSDLEKGLEEVRIQQLSRSDPELEEPETSSNVQVLDEILEGVRALVRRADQEHSARRRPKITFVDDETTPNGSHRVNTKQLSILAKWLQDVGLTDVSFDLSDLTSTAVSSS